MAITNKDKKIIRELAKKVQEVANHPEQKEKTKMWLRHNRLERVKPMVLIFPEGSWRELLPEKNLIATDPFCRDIERDLRIRLYYSEHLRDDSVIRGTIYSRIVINNSGWGVTISEILPNDPLGAIHYKSVIKEEADIGKLRKPQLTIDQVATEKNYQKLCELVGGILSVERRGVDSFQFCIIDEFARLRGLAQLYLDMVDRPEWLHRILNFMVAGNLEMLNFLEKNNLLSLNNNANYVGSGGLGFTDELPQPDFDGIQVRTKDLWGGATTQMFSEVSPAMHEEFALQYEKRLLERFGLNCYGCCEPLHKKIDIIRKHIPRIRRISMSPWVDVEEAAEKLGNNCIFSYKPNPAIVAGEEWNAEAVRHSIYNTLKKTRGCIIELIMKDVHTCRNQPPRLWEWTKIAMGVANEFAS